MPKTPTPCIGVCKFKRLGPAGKHCIACSMTKPQKKLARRARKTRETEGFFALVQAQQRVMGQYGHWRRAFLDRCVRKERTAPASVRSDA